MPRSARSWYDATVGYRVTSHKISHNVALSRAQTENCDRHVGTLFCLYLAWFKQSRWQEDWVCHNQQSQLFCVLWKIKVFRYQFYLWNKSIQILNLKTWKWNLITDHLLGIIVQQKKWNPHNLLIIFSCAPYYSYEDFLQEN